MPVEPALTGDVQEGGGTTRSVSESFHPARAGAQKQGQGKVLVEFVEGHEPK